MLGRHFASVVTGKPSSSLTEYALIAIFAYSEDDVTATASVSAARQFGHPHFGCSGTRIAEYSRHHHCARPAYRAAIHRLSANNLARRSSGRLAGAQR